MNNACRARLMTVITTSSIDCRGTIRSISGGSSSSSSIIHMTSNRSYHVSIKTNTMYPRSRVVDEVESMVLKGVYTELARQVHLQSFISMKSSNHHHHHNEDTDEDIVDNADLKMQLRTDNSLYESVNSFI